MGCTEAARCCERGVRRRGHGRRSGGFLAGVRRCFAELRDPRVQASCDHLFFDIVSIAILAVACGADEWTDLETFGKCPRFTTDVSDARTFGKKRREWLATFLELRGGIPSHDTFRRVFGLLDRKQFAACLLQWTQTLREASGGKLMAIDGQALRRSARKKSGLGMLHLVTAWSSENGLTLAQVACDEKSNEITAIPEVLIPLDIKCCTITIDAMGCQKVIAQKSACRRDIMCWLLTGISRIKYRHATTRSHRS